MIGKSDLVTVDYIKQGRKNRRLGAVFENKVRKDREGFGYFISKFQSNVDLETNKFIPAKGNRFFMRTCGFPDFICWNKAGPVIGIECKTNGTLSSDEIKKCDFLLNNNIFTQILIASYHKEKTVVVGHKRRIAVRTSEIEYVDFIDYKNKRVKY